jgi:replicative DNA helicase
MTYRAAPHNIEAEQELLGAILVNNEAFGVVERLIEPEHFFEPIHQQIYVTAKLIRAGNLATPITLKCHLPTDLDIAGMSLGQYLARLCAEATTVINAPDFAKVVRNLAHRRTLMDIGEEMIDLAADGPVDFLPDVLAQEMIERIDEAVAARTETNIPRISIGEAARRAADKMCETMARDGAIGGITTGLTTLDNATNGLQRGDLVLLAGRPGMGKSGLMESSALKTAAAGFNCLIFSLEMGLISLAQRAISDLLYDSRDPIPYWKIGRGELDQQQAEKVVGASRDLGNLPLESSRCRP